MIPILNAEQIRNADAFTIANEPVSSVDLMERAASSFVEIFSSLNYSGCRLKIFCGTGNNGGDGLAVARLLLEQGYHVEVYTTGYLGKTTEDFRHNYDRFLKLAYAEHLDDSAAFPLLDEGDVVIDALFGSGLSRGVTGWYGDLIEHINQSSCEIVSIDIASGLYSDQPAEKRNIIKPCHTISFQLPKLVFFQPDLHEYVGKWHVTDIGLDRSFIDSQETDFYFTESKDISAKLKTRSKFIHKGEAGRMLLFSGSLGKMGATVLAAKAAMRSGTGLLQVHVPACGVHIIQTAVPEAMASMDESMNYLSEMTDTFSASAIAVGPGIGTSESTMAAFKSLLENTDKPIVIDADAINLLSMNRALLGLIPKESILTPHPGEFKRLVGEWHDDFQKLQLLSNFCKSHEVNMVLKGAYSAVCNTDGKVFFNPTGNPGMATAGSGDVLTGVIASLLAQGYNPTDALIMGVYLHGLAGDMAAQRVGFHSLIASDIIQHLPDAFLSIQRY